MTRRRWAIIYGALVLIACAVAYVGVRGEETRDRTLVLERQSACLEDERSAECAASITAAIKRCVSEPVCRGLLESVIRRAAAEPRAGGESDTNSDSARGREPTASGPSDSSAPQAPTPPAETAPPSTPAPDEPAPPPSPEPPPGNPNPPDPPPPNEPDRGLLDDVTDTVCSVNAAGIRICL